MEREISTAVDLMVMLVAVSALLGIVFFTVYMSSEMQAGVTDEMGDVRSNMSTGYVQSLTTLETDNEMPTATAYNILKTYDKTIVESSSGLDGTVTNNMIENPSIGEHLKGRVSLEVIDLGNDTFIAFVHTGSKEEYEKGKVTCNWNYSENPRCSCEDRSGFQELLDKYELTTDYDM